MFTQLIFVIEAHDMSHYAGLCRDLWTSQDLAWSQVVSCQHGAVPELVSSTDCQALPWAEGSTAADTSLLGMEPVLHKAFCCENIKAFFGIFALHHSIRGKTPVTPRYSSEHLAHMTQPQFCREKDGNFLLLYENVETDLRLVALTLPISIC